MDAQSFLDRLENPPDEVEQMSFDHLIADQPAPPSAAPADATPPVSGRHQDVRLYLTVLLKTYAETLDAGLVREAPFAVRLSESRTYQPDITFVASRSYERVGDTVLEGAPELVMEVLTRESTALDRGEKFVAYEAAGVQEYWLVDPVREMVDLYALGPAGTYVAFRPDIAGRLRSRVLKGFMVELDVLWKRVLPTTTDIVNMVQAMTQQR